MTKLYILARSLQIANQLKSLVYNRQARLILTILIFILFENSRACLFAIILFLYTINLNFISPLLLVILIIFSPLLQFKKLPSEHQEFVVIDKISGRYILWDLEFPLKFYSLNSYEEHQVFDKIYANSITYNQLDNTYFNSLNIIAEVNFKVSKTSKTFLSALTEIKETLQSRLETSLKNKNSELIKGFLFGGSTLTDKELKENLKTLGISHIVSVSGFNFIIIQSLIINLAIIIRRRILTITSIIFFLLFYLLIGPLNLSALRAMLMILLISGCGIAGKPIRRINLALLAILAVACLSSSLIHNISFQLSMAATCGLTFLSQYINRILVIKWKLLRESFAVSTTSFISTLPIILINFNNLSWGGLIMNLVFLPFVPILMFLGFIISLIGNQNNLGLMLSDITGFISNIFLYLSTTLSQITVFNIEKQNAITILCIFSIIYLIFDLKKWSKRYSHWK